LRIFGLRRGWTPCIGHSLAGAFWNTRRPRSSERSTETWRPQPDRTAGHPIALGGRDRRGARTNPGKEGVSHWVVRRRRATAVSESSILANTTRARNTAARFTRTRFNRTRAARSSSVTTTSARGRPIFGMSLLDHKSGILLVISGSPPRWARRRMGGAGVVGHAGPARRHSAHRRRVDLRRRVAGGRSIPPTGARAGRDLTVTALPTA
jgi:hypothetical protein